MGTTTSDMENTWVTLGAKIECNTRAGEVYMKQSPGKGSNLEDCKTSCQNNADCQSITLMKNGWCSHYSTPCTKSKKKRRAVISMRLVAESGSTSSPTATQNPSMAWEQ